MTCGPTWVKLDGVRVISNHSTGELGHGVASGLEKAGATVTLLEGPVTHVAKLKSSRVIRFNYFNEFSKIFKRELTKKYDCVIHAAAVSDYRPLRQRRGKISSSLQRVRFQLIPTEKLIAKVKTISPGSFLVGFKLECLLDRKFLKVKALKLINDSGCALVVANGQSGRRYAAFIFDQEGRILEKVKTRHAIAHRLIKILGKAL